jgi:hypothetical protein
MNSYYSTCVAMKKHVFSGLASFSVILLLNFNSVVTAAEPNQDFNALLAAYAKSKIKYHDAQAPSFLPGQDQDFEEEMYWSQQYYFYRSKILGILSSYDQAARKDPRSYCRKALKMYSQYEKADQVALINEEINSLGNGFDDWQHRPEQQLSRYCSRFDIDYDPSNEKM